MYCIESVPENTGYLYFTSLEAHVSRGKGGKEYILHKEAGIYVHQNTRRLILMVA